MNRKSNLELLRILSMCGIVALHYINPTMGMAIQNAVYPNFSWIFSNVLLSFSVPLVNCFVLISGYFLIGKTVFNLRKIVDILLTTFFYGAVCYFLWVLITGNGITAGELFEACIPFTAGRRWFVESYIILLLFAPFLNILLNHISRRDYRLLLSIQIFLFSVWYSVGVSAPLLDDGYGITNFITLYMLGGYIRLHGKDGKFLPVKKRYCFVGYCLCSLATFALSIFINPYGYAFLTNIAGAALIFAAFLNWDAGIIPWVNKISAASFDVYFVHSDYYTAALLMYHLLGAKRYVDSPWLILHMVIVIIAVWVLGITGFILRKRLFSAVTKRKNGKRRIINREIDIC